MYPEDLYYAETHEWLRVENGQGTVGITEFAQEELGDVVFVEFPEEGETFAAGEPFAVVESVKTISDVYMPVDAAVEAVNETLIDQPERVNEAPYTDGWLVRIELQDPGGLDHLMSAEEYTRSAGIE